jgi:hypothetical protein
VLKAKSIVSQFPQVKAEHLLIAKKNPKALLTA